MVYNRTAGFGCCGRNYILQSTVNDVCCDGRFHAQQDNHMCCSGEYVLVLPGSVCCPTDDGGVTTGIGDACCGGMPYIANDSVICCGGRLYSNHSTRKCCGSEIISTLSTKCCNGVAHLQENGHTCCGSLYTETDTTLCCTGSTGVSQVRSTIPCLQRKLLYFITVQVYYYTSRDEKISANEQCCQFNKIPASFECCNGIAYDNATEVCADQSTSNTGQLQCGMGNICNITQANNAFCDRCNFNPATSTCGIINNTISIQRPNFGCFETTLVFSGQALHYQAQNLNPFTQYGFSITAINSAGNLSTSFTTVTTLQASPTFVDSPVLFVQSATAIMISWLRPVEPNGRITNYNLYQNNSLINSSTDTMFTAEDLLPYTSYQYHIEACTSAGCTASATVTSTTLQAIPEDLEPLTITIINPTEIRLGWLPPQQPNGVITLYIVNETQGSNSITIFQHSMLRTFTLSDRSPFTTYYFVLQACTIAGCLTAPTVDVTTPQAPPEGLDPPFLQILNSTTVDVSWTQPNVLNGEIITYILRRDNTVIYNGTELRYFDTGLVANIQYNYTIEAVNGGGSVVSIATIIRTPENIPNGLVPPNLFVINSTTIQVTWNPPTTPNGMIISYTIIYDNQNIDVGLTLEYTATSLLAATQYSFRIEACNRLGCARSLENTATTNEAPPTGFDNPILTALGSTAVNIVWSEPRILNGVILRYEAYRRETGSILQSLQFSGNQTTFINAGLLPFTSYEYRIRAINSAGSVFTDWVEVVTLEDIPQDVNGPTFPLVFARNITVDWTTPSSPNGIITFYEVYQREFLGTARLVARVASNTTTFIATDLIPARIYEFQIVAINSVGQNESPWVTVSTTEAPPEGLQPIVIESQPSSGTSLVLSWVEPLIPNGQILEYIVYLDNTIEFRGTDMTATIRRLNPFTTYMLQLEVCNSGGCSRGIEQNATTAEIPPVEQGPPQLTVIGPTIVQIRWEPPQIPNGIIIQYDIIRRLPTPFGSNTNTSATVFANVSDVVTRVYVDSSLEPFTFYEYAIRAINSGGQTVGPFVIIQTSQDIPEGIPPPSLTAASSSEIRISWNDPAIANGIITEYRVVRNGSVIRSTLDRLFVDTNLMPFTYYAYSITVCTIAGCGSGLAEIVRTMEAAPSGVSTPMLTALSNSSIRIDWIPPSMPNGLITMYTVTVLPNMINITTLQISINVQNLLPFTLYQVTILACTQAGCTLSIPSEVRTLEGIPRLIDPPQLLVLGPTIIEAVWRLPLIPNGIITRYELQRNGTTIYTANATTYIDRNVQPNQLYSYAVRAFTDIGPGSYSDQSIIMTSEDTPSGIQSPILVSLSATSIRASWQSPLMPNGNITEYRLVVNGVNVFTGLQFSFIVTDLNPFTDYEFQLIACTSTCGSSEHTTITTQEAAPTGQNPPQLMPTAYNMVTISWEQPTNPNGRIISYRLERQLVGDNISTIIFTGLATSFNDVDDSLMAAMYYEYRVTSFNSIGNSTSAWQQVLLPEAIPEGVLPPTIFNITATSVTLNISYPRIPNGIITMYHIIQDNITLTTSGNTTLFYTVYNLMPFTNYAFYVQACTVIGCQQSGPSLVTTQELPPLNLAPPTVFIEGPRNLFINWSSPADPRGYIIR